MESENTLSSDAGSPELQAARPTPNRTLPSPGKEVRLTLSPEAGTADSEPFALCNFISVQLQISVCLQNYIMCHSPSCYSSKPILCTPICLPACLINPQEGREREAKFSLSHRSHLSFIFVTPPTVRQNHRPQSFRERESFVNRSLPSSHHFSRKINVFYVVS